MPHSRHNTAKQGSASADILDALVIGAGITGIHQLHALRAANFRAELVEAGSQVGGTWYWNRYPGARFDCESYTYAYLFSADLFSRWEWTEHFAGQPEIERYLNWVVDELGLRQHIHLDSRVSSARFFPEEDYWLLATENGEEFRTRLVVAAIGLLSQPQYPDIDGIPDFRGRSFHTSRWPAEAVDFSGARVGVFGTASSGVQVIQSIASAVSELVVFQRTAHWCTPLNNSSITPAEQAELQSGYEQLRDRLRSSAFGSLHEPIRRATLDDAEDERIALFGFLWNRGGFAKYWGNYFDIITSRAANNAFCEFAADRIRARVRDPETAARLIPSDHGYGIRRPPFETHYYEVYNQDNVTLVDLRATPVQRVTSGGVRTTDREYPLDIIVYATGFDVGTGPFNAIDIRGLGGRRLRAAWADGPRTFLSVAAPGFPNFFFAGGPHTATVNLPRATEAQVDLITGCLRYMREHGYSRAEADAEATAAWTRRASESVNGTLLTEAKDWTFGVNTPGKKKAYLQHLIHLGELTKHFRQVGAAGYQGFHFQRQAS